MSGLIRPFGRYAPRLAADVFVAPGATIVGDVEIGMQSSIWYGCVLRGDRNAIRIGSRTNIQDGTVIHINGEPEGRRGSPGWQTVVGSDVTVGHMALLHACTLEDRAFVGMRACVLDGAVVESEAMVAAGAVVTPGKRVRRGELWAGCPARLMRPMTQAEFDNIERSARNYVRLAAEHGQEAADSGPPGERT